MENQHLRSMYGKSERTRARDSDDVFFSTSERLGQSVRLRVAL